MKLYFIRHGATQGNREHRYVGRTDEGILTSEKEKLKKTGQALPYMDGIFVSPCLRCLQSAESLFGVRREDFMIQGLQEKGSKGAEQKENTDVFQKGTAGRRIELIEDFREMDFGAFEYKNYQELNGNLDYQKFIDSGGLTGFPGGELPEDFKYRCREAFVGCIRKVQENHWEHVGFVIHGGTIMAIMEAFGYPKRGYYDYQVQTGCGYVVCQKESCKDAEIKLEIEQEIGK